MTGDRDAGRLLALLAGALNACDAAGLDVKLKHGIVFTTGGYVLPVGGGWAPRTLAYTPFSSHGGDDD